MKIQRYNESSSDDKTVKVKDLIEYLQTLDQEAEVSLDKDGWGYGSTPMETIKLSGVFHYWTFRGENLLTINN
jgi:hypothetical protein